jgi:SprT-like family
LPDTIRFAVAFTSQGKKGKVAGECWHAGASDDGHHEIIIRADFAEPAEVLGILVHELVHAALPPDAKHGKQFREAALKIGLEGQMRHALPGLVLRERLNELAATLGPFPHARLNFDRVTLTGMQAADKPKKQGTRLLKAECIGPGCGYTVRVAARWITEAGPPHCPVHGAMTTPMAPPRSAVDGDET